MKKCKVCGTLKPIESFYINRRMKDGRLNVCNACCVISGVIQHHNKDKLSRQMYGIGRRTISTYGLRMALFIYDRAGRKCEQCGEENDLTIHHKDRNGRNNLNKGLPQNNNVKNLVVLCRRCHGSIHGKQNRKKRGG